LQNFFIAPRIATHEKTPIDTRACV